MATTNIYASGHSSVANVIIDSASASITYPNSLVTTDVSINEIISDFFHHRAGVVSCPWYEGNGPCSVQIRLALPDMFDVSGMSDASFNDYRKSMLDGFVGAFGNVNLGNEVAMSQSIYRGDMSNSTYNFLCVYPSVGCAAYYWLAATQTITSGFDTGRIFGSLIGFYQGDDKFSTPYTVSGETWTLNPGYNEHSVSQNYFLFTGLNDAQKDYFKNVINLNKSNTYWHGAYKPSNGDLFRYATPAAMTSTNNAVEGFFRPEISISGTIENIDIYNTVHPYNTITQTSQAYGNAEQLTGVSFELTFPEATYLPPTAAEFAALSLQVANN